MPDAPAPIARGQTARDQSSRDQSSRDQTARDQAAGLPAKAGMPARPGAATAPVPAAAPSQLLSELKVSGHLMTLESGLYCIVQTPAKGAEPGSGLPGVRLSLPPGSSSRPDAVSIASFRPDGWLASSGDAALVRIADGPAQLLVTIYQAPSPQDGGAPNIQVMRLLDATTVGSAPGAVPGTAPSGQGVGPAAAVRVAADPAPRGAVAARSPAVMEMVAHIQERGDVGSMLGDWLGERGSKRWIEGFGLSPTRLISPKEIEYQGVLGQGWLSPWVEGGQFCGSRAMALPLLGLRVRLRGEAAAQYEVAYSASFIDGTAVGPSLNGEACEADSLAAMEAFQIVIRPRAVAEAAAAGRQTAAKPARGKARAEPVSEPVAVAEAPKSSRKGKAAEDKAKASGRKR